MECKSNGRNFSPYRKNRIRASAKAGIILLETRDEKHVKRDPGEDSTMKMRLLGTILLGVCVAGMIVAGPVALLVADIRKMR